MTKVEAEFYRKQLATLGRKSHVDRVVRHRSGSGYVVRLGDGSYLMQPEEAESFLQALRAEKGART